MTYIKPGGRTWIKTELNDPLANLVVPKVDQETLDEIEDRIWEELFPRGLPEPGTTVTFTKRHVDWCHDDTCPGKVASVNDQAWERHWSHRRDGGHRSSTT